jgi:hypothetical protein
LIAGIFGGSGFVAPCTRVLSNSDLSRRFVHRTSDRSRSEVLCTHGGQPSELVQSPSENDMGTNEIPTRRVAMANTYNLFISHSWAYGDAYEKLIGLLDSKGGYFPYKNYSVPQNDPIHNAPNQVALRAAIERQIKPASVVLILAGVYSTYSKWINVEIEIAKQLGKPIIAIEPWGSEKTSAVVKNAADKIVKWQTDSIVSAIRAIA